MKALIETLPRRCVEKPGVTRDALDDEEYGVLGGFLDGFARFILDESPPVLLLRCRNSVRRRLQKLSSAIRVSKRMGWKREGWAWTDVILDGSIPKESLLSLIDDSYQLVYDSLPDDEKQQITLLSRNLPPAELLSELISHFGLSSWEREIRKLLRPALLLKTRPAKESRLALGQTKIGGSPDHPGGCEWPTYRDGKPLAFLAQINLAEVPEGFERGGLPDGGMLYFFSVFGWQVEGDADPQLPHGQYDFDWTQILYHPSGKALLQRQRTPAGVNSFKPAKVDFVPILSLPTDTKEPRVAKLKWQRGVKGKYDRLVSSFNDACSYQLHHPARNLLLGFADYEQHFVGEVAEQKLQLLFQLDSDDSAEMCWGDGGLIYFWIRPQDVKRRNFKRVYTDYQCG
jgi:predicted DNA-binding protein (MmcQ/YjbR family)